MKIIYTDVFYIQLIKSVEKWYDNNYMEKSNKKDIHINKIKENYDSKRFINIKNLCEERTKFLEEIHILVWENTEIINI